MQGRENKTCGVHSYETFTIHTIHTVTTIYTTYIACTFKKVR